jgi:hypothetical protein
MIRTCAAVLGAAVLSAAMTTGPAFAGGAQHAFFPEDYDASEHFDAGQGPCVPWAGTFHEVRHGGYKLVVPAGGQVAGELHVNGTIDGLVELIPDDRALPTYVGTYREKTDGVVVSSSPEEDVERIGQFRLRSTLTGTDGSTVELRLSGKTTVNANGRATVDRQVFECV